MPLSPGTRLGPYEVLSPIGAGGMGEVYRARDTKLDRDVALKVLPEPVAADGEALARFEREAKAVAGLSHPNILSIFDFGTHDGIAYAVTELLEGETLRGTLSAGVPPQRLAVDYALQIAKGLRAAHQKGIVHRDLKPENVFVGNDGHVKILDFGLAKRMAPESPDDLTSAPTESQHTTPGTVLGTAGYMSPEQVRGRAVDHRSDLFSLGAILYELLSGKKAFVRESAADTMAAILKEEPPELSGSGQSIPSALDRVVRHCLEKRPEQRFQSAQDVVFALSEATSGVVTGVPQAPPPAAAGRKRAVAAAVVIAVGLVAAAGVVLLRQIHKETAEGTGQKRIAVLPFENLGRAEDDYFADGMADEVRGKLTSLPGLEVIARGSSTQYKRTTKTPAQIAQELGVRYLLTATLRWEKAAGVSRVHVSPELVEVVSATAPVSRWEQRFDAEMTDVFQVQSDIATRVSKELGVALGAREERRLGEKPTQNNAAYDAFLRGEAAWNGADPSPTNDTALRLALAAYEEAVALDPKFARAWARISQLNGGEYGWRPTPALAERIRQAAEQAVALAPDRPEGYVALGNYEDSVHQDRLRALELYTEGQRRAPGDAQVLLAIAGAEQELGRWDAAVEHAEQAVRLDVRSANAHEALGNFLFYLRRYPEAREAYDRALALVPADVRLIGVKAQTFVQQGDLAGARAVLRAAPKEVEPVSLVAFMAVFGDEAWVLDEEQREVLRRLTPSFFVDRGTWALCLAQAYALKEDRANVRFYAEQARVAFEEEIRAYPQNGQQFHSYLGWALAYLGRGDEAVREGERGAELAPVAKFPVGGAYLQEVLARIHILLGHQEKALDLLEPLLKIPGGVSPGYLRINPVFDPLRGNPRFQRLVADGK